MRLAPLIVVLALAGCKTCPPIEPPKVVEVTVTKIVPVPDELTNPCPIYTIKSQTYGEAVAAANHRKASLEACNKRLSEIRALGR